MRSVMCETLIAGLAVVLFGCSRSEPPENQSMGKAAAKPTAQQHRPATVTPPHEPASAAQQAATPDFNEVRDDFFKGVEWETGGRLTSFDQQSIIMSLKKVYEDGGQRWQNLHSGEVFQEMPKYVKNWKDYVAFFMLRNSSQYRKCSKPSREAVKNHPKFKALAACELYRATTSEKQDILASSIARTYCLGGEIQADPYTIITQGWVRELPQGVETVGNFVDYLIQRNTPEYTATIQKLLRDHGDQIDKIYEAYKEYLRAHPVKLNRGQDQ